MNTKIVLGMALAASALSGCTTVAREPEVRTQRVVIEKPVSCVPKNLGPAPTYPDTDEALRKAHDLAERYLLLWAGRELRSARLGETEPVIQTCKDAIDE
jgi:hypothetical protein